jgi:tRNA (guanine-N7-)-methyltransferase
MTLNDDKTVIRRRRKKYKFAKFAGFTNCFEANEFTVDARKKFSGERRLIVELGAGTALFLVELAKRHPTRRFIAADVKADRLVKGAKLALEQGVGNIVFVRAHANQLDEILAKNSVSELWLTFSDPFPKKRHIKHRMTHEAFLRQYRDLLIAGGVLHFKTDNLGLFCWSLEQFAANRLRLSNLTFDLHSSDLPDDYRIMTTYEERFVAEGLPIYSADAYFD